MSRVFLLHENPEWVAPLESALDTLAIPFEVWNIAEGALDLDTVPPFGVFYCRMSASAHTRGHHLAAEYATALLLWLERHERPVVNGSRSVLVETSKVRQYMALTEAGLRVPPTRVAVGAAQVRAAAAGLGYPLIVKPNRGGKGLGVQKFDSEQALMDYVTGDAFDAGPDGTVLVQKYIQPEAPYIIRNEFVAGRHLYSVRVDTQNGFELCPAEACAIGDLACPIGEGENQFDILPDFEAPEIARYERLLASENIDIAGIEMIRGDDGLTYTYDINVNTNYNPDAEARALGPHRPGGMLSVATYLGELLQRANVPVTRSA
ncbi:MAG: alpha-L-glutamate ligase [Pseudomonadota bacterium]